MIRKWMLIIVVVVAWGLSSLAKEKLVVAVEGINRKCWWGQIDWKFKNYGIKLRRYFRDEIYKGGAHTRTPEPGPKEAAFIADLQKAQLLVVDASDVFYYLPKCREAVNAFLARGGTILYQYNTIITVPTVLGCGKNLGIEPMLNVPVEVPADCLSPLVRKPHDLSKLGSWGFRGYGAIKKWSDRQQTLLHKKGDPDKAFLILFEGVKGKGRIIINRMYGLFNAVPGKKANGAIAANIMHYVWGDIEKGAEISIAGAAPETFQTRVPVTTLNMLYFNGLKKSVWWNADWRYRVPLIVREPMKVDRKNLVVTVDCRLPGNADLSSIRVISQGGRELISQARILDAAKHRFRVAFVDDLDAGTTHGYFIYCDDKTKPNPNYRDQVSLWKDQDFITLRNNRVEATLGAEQPGVYALQALGNSTGNQFHHGFGERMGTGFKLYGLPKSESSCVVLDNGPVRKTLEYRLKDKNGVMKPLIQFSMEAGSPLLHWEYLHKQMWPHARLRWLPGRGPNAIPNSFAWAAKNSLRKMEFTYENLGGNKATPLGEGWYAFTDGATGQVVGELFDFTKKGGVGWHAYGGLSSASWGYLVCTRARRGPYRRAMVALPDYSGTLRLRHEYLFYKNPPQVALATAQNRGDCLAKPVQPVWNKSFISYFHLGFYPQASFQDPWKNSYAAYWREMMPVYRDEGYNGIGLFPCLWKCFKLGKYVNDGDTKPSFATELVDQARKQGMATYICPPRMSGSFIQFYRQFVGEGILNDKKGKDGSYQLSLDKIKTAACKGEAIIAAEKPGMVWLTDEMGYVIRKGDKELFYKKYGMNPVGKPWHTAVKAAKLAEPAQHNTVLFQMNAYTDILRSMARTVRAIAPETIIGDQVNPSMMSRIDSGAPHDWEAQADYLDTISMDLYDWHRPLYKYLNKLMLGMFNNRKAVIQVVGCTSPPGSVYPSVACPAMWGVKVFSFFPSRNTDVLRATQEMHKTNAYFLNTGLGDLMASMYPSRHIALLRDRQAMLDDIKKGKWSGSYGSRHDTAVAHFSLIPNFQADILMTRYLTPDNLKSYKTLIVAADPVLAKKHCKTIENYVKGGGHVIIEGNSLRSPELQELAGLKLSGQRKNRKVSVKDTFSFRGTVFDLKPADARIALVSDKGTPLMFERKLGAGTVSTLAFDISLRLGGQDDLQTFVRTLCNQVAGPGLVSLEKSLCSKIDSNLLEDGRGNYVFSSWNRSRDTQHVIIKWNKKETPERVVNVAAGTSADFDGTLEFDLKSGQVKQFFIGRKGRFEVPEARILPAGAMPGYSQFPGKNVLDFNAMNTKKEADAAVKKRPSKIAGYSYVAVYDPETSANYKSGAGAIIDTLSKAKGINVVKIKDMSLENLIYYDAVVVPNVGPVTKQMGDGLKNLRKYVLAGGAVLLCHRSAGTAPALFPEVGTPRGQVNRERDMEVIAAHPITTDLVVKKRYPEDYRNPAFQAQIDANILKVGNRFRTGFADYVALSPAKGAVTLISA